MAPVAFGALGSPLVVLARLTGLPLEHLILRYVFKRSLALAFLVGVLVLLQACVFPGVVP